MSLKEYFQINVFTVQASFEYEYVAQIKNGSFARRFTRLHKKTKPRSASFHRRENKNICHYEYYIKLKRHI